MMTVGFLFSEPPTFLGGSTPPSEEDSKGVFTSLYLM